MIREMSLKTISVILAVLIILGICGIAVYNYSSENAINESDSTTTAITNSTTMTN